MIHHANYEYFLDKLTTSGITTAMKRTRGYVLVQIYVNYHFNFFSSFLFQNRVKKILEDAKKYMDLRHHNLIDMESMRSIVQNVGDEIREAVTKNNEFKLSKLLMKKKIISSKSKKNNSSITETSGDNAASTASQSLPRTTLERPELAPPPPPQPPKTSADGPAKGTAA